MKIVTYLQIRNGEVKILYMGTIVNKWLMFSLIATLTSLCYIIVPTCDSYASEKSLPNTVFSLQTNKETMYDVLEKISKASGYKIILKTDIEDVPVSIQLNDVTLHKAIRRIFSNYDHVEVWDDVEKTLKLYIWSTKGVPVSISGKKRKFVPTTKTFQK